MSRKIAIVGAGQSGLPLALALALQGRDDTVTLVTNRSPDELRRGKVMSSQCMFDNALQIERDFGLYLWADDCPPVEGIGLTVPHPEQRGERLIDPRLRGPQLVCLRRAGQGARAHPRRLEPRDRQGAERPGPERGPDQARAHAPAHHPCRVRGLHAQGVRPVGRHRPGAQADGGMRAGRRPPA